MSPLHFSISLFCVLLTQEDLATNELTFLEDAHSRDMISENEQAENEIGRWIFPPFSH